MGCVSHQALQVHAPRCAQVHLADSFEFKRNGNSWGQQDLYGAIKYRVKAECDVAGSKHDIKCRSPILVVQFPTRPPVEVVQRDAQPITCCCCCNNGSAVITARVQKDIYSPGEMVCALLEVENLSGTQFEAVLLELRRTVKLSAGHEHATDKSTLQSASYPGTFTWCVIVTPAFVLREITCTGCSFDSLSLRQALRQARCGLVLAL